MENMIANIKESDIIKEEGKQEKIIENLIYTIRECLTAISMFNTFIMGGKIIWN